MGSVGAQSGHSDQLGKLVGLGSGDLSAAENRRPVLVLDHQQWATIGANRGALLRDGGTVASRTGGEYPMPQQAAPYRVSTREDEW